MLYPCPRCQTFVPEWFLEQIIPFHVLMRQMGTFDSVSVPCEWEEGNPELEGDPERRAPVPNTFGDHSRYACYYCTNGWPFPMVTAVQSPEEATETEEDYVERLSLWRQDQAEKQEATQNLTSRDGVIRLAGGGVAVYLSKYEVDHIHVILPEGARVSILAADSGLELQASPRG